MFNAEIDVAAIMREIKQAAQAFDENSYDTDNLEDNISAIKNELIRINDFIYNTQNDSEKFVEMGKEIPINMSRPYIIRKLLTLYRRFFRKSTRFLALDQKKYNEYVSAEVKALQEGQSQVIKLIDLIMAVKSENINLQNQVKEFNSSMKLIDSKIRKNDREVQGKFELISNEMSANIAKQMSNSVKDFQKEWKTQFDDFSQKVHQSFFKKTHIDDKIYCSFEDKFRGSSDEIKRRLNIYINKYILPNIRNKQEERILDLGCGRGEFLELLAENGYIADGVDSNEEMVNI